MKPLLLRASFAFAFLIGVPVLAQSFPPSGGVQVRESNGRTTLFTPVSDTNLARGVALTNATALVNEVARKAAVDGCALRAGLTLHPDGYFYGVAAVGGKSNRAGVIYRMSPRGAYSVIHHCSPALGTNPRAQLRVGSDGALYGTMEAGGSEGSGVVFRVSTSGEYTVLRHLSPNTDGAGPLAGLSEERAGAFYGATNYGGANGQGTLFRITSSGSFDVLRQLANATGSRPVAPPTWLDGDLYGVMMRGGSTDHGVIYRLSPSGAYSVIHEFNGLNGSYPMGELCVADEASFLGTTFSGGASYVSSPGVRRAFGTLFRISTSGAFATLHSFTASSRDGGYPVTGLMKASDGNFYGVTREGGYYNAGTAFRMTPGGELTLIRHFSEKNGYLPSGVLVEGSDGGLFGTAHLGGKNRSGEVFKLSKNGRRFTTLHSCPAPVANATVTVGPGTYEVAQPVYLLARAVRLRGVGMDRTTIRAKDFMAVSDSLVKGVYYSGLAGGSITVMDMTVDGNLANQNFGYVAHCVSLAGSYNRIKRVRAIGWGSKSFGVECFPIGISSAGGGPFSEHFIHGVGRMNYISNCVGELPAATFHADGASVITNTGSYPANWDRPGSGWVIGGYIRDCIVRGPENTAQAPRYLHAYGSSTSRLARIHNNYAENLTKNTDYTGVYHDTGSLFDHTVSNNRFVNCTRGFVFHIGSDTAVTLRGIHLLNNIHEGISANNHSFSVLFATSKLSTIERPVVRGNALVGHVGIYLESIAPIHKPIVTNNVVTAVRPFWVSNLESPAFGNNTDKLGNPISP